MADVQYESYTKYVENSESIFLMARPNLFYFLFSFAIKVGREKCSNLIKILVFNYFGPLWSVSPRFCIIYTKFKENIKNKFADASSVFSAFMKFRKFFRKTFKKPSK